MDKFKTLNDFIKLWRNECTRTFIDKLCDPDDVVKVASYIPELVKEYFPSCAADELDDDLVFGDFMMTSPDDE